MKVYQDEETRKRVEASRSFSGSTPFEAALDDAIIDKLKMREALESFGRALIPQFAKRRNSDGKTVVGVNLTTISFSLVFDVDEKETLTP